MGPKHPTTNSYSRDGGRGQQVWLSAAQPRLKGSRSSIAGARCPTSRLAGETSGLVWNLGQFRLWMHAHIRLYGLTQDCHQVLGEGGGRATACHTSAATITGCAVVLPESASGCRHASHEAVVENKVNQGLRAVVEWKVDSRGLSNRLN